MIYNLVNPHEIKGNSTFSEIQTKLRFYERSDGKCGRGRDNVTICLRKGVMCMDREPFVILEYQEGSDGLMYPKIQISNNAYYDRGAAGMFGRQWKDYMREKHPQRLSVLIVAGKINEMICQVNEEAERKKEKLIQQLLEVQLMPETEDPLARAGHMGMITRQAEEIVLNEVVYQLH